MATSQQYPNSSSSLPESSPRLYSPLLRPGSSVLSGPNNRPTRKKNSVAINSESSKKCPNIKTIVMWRVCVKPSAYAKPHASDVRVRKKESRYVNDGSGRWYVLVVCFYTLLGTYRHTETRNTYMVVYLSKHLLGCYYQAHDLPYGHFKVHLGEFEHALEEARHLDLIPPCRWGRAKV